MNQSVVVITGGTRGIGLGMAKAFYQQGDKVVMNYCQDDNQAQSVLKTFNQESAYVVKANIALADEQQHLLDETLNRFGKIDVLINNAGIIRPGRFLDVAKSDFDAVVDVNFHGPFWLSRLVANHWVEREQPGNIIQILSVGAHGPGNISYCTAKAALLFASKCMAKELAKHGIRVNSISPDGVATDLNKEAREKTPERWQKRVMKNPMARCASADEVAQAAIFLASTKASYITGVDIPVDGGRLLT